VSDTAAGIASIARGPSLWYPPRSAGCGAMADPRRLGGRSGRDHTPPFASRWRPWVPPATPTGGNGQRAASARQVRLPEMTPKVSPRSSMRSTWRKQFGRKSRKLTQMVQWLRQSPQTTHRVSLPPTASPCLFASLCVYLVRTALLGIQGLSGHYCVAYRSAAGGDCAKGSCVRCRKR